jgi:hypothetical protein
MLNNCPRGENLSNPVALVRASFWGQKTSSLAKDLETVLTLTKLLNLELLRAPQKSDFYNINKSAARLSEAL